jgi:hypothetical protein
MADPHGHTTASSPQAAHAAHADHDAHDDHGAAPEEDVLRTPSWLPFVGLALLLAGSVGVYELMSGSSHAAGAGDGGVEAGAQAGDGGVGVH